MTHRIASVLLVLIAFCPSLQGCRNAEREQRDQALLDFDVEKTGQAYYDLFPDWTDSMKALRSQIERGTIRPVDAGTAFQSFQERWRRRNPNAVRVIEDSIKAYQERMARLSAQYAADSSERASRAFEDSMIQEGHRQLCDMPAAEVDPQLAELRRRHCQ